MPTIPGAISTQSFQARTSVPMEDVATAGAQQRRGASSLVEASDGLLSMIRQGRAVEEATKESVARSGYLTDMVDQRTSLRTVDPAEIEPRWQAGRQQIFERYASTLSGDAAIRFRAHAAAIDAQENGNIQALRTQRAGDVSVASMVTELDGLRRSAAEAPTPAARQTAVEGIDSSIAARVASGAITNEAGARLRIQTLGRVDETSATALMNQNPSAALQALRSGRFSHLDPQTSERMINSAETRIAAQAARAEAARARQERAVGLELGQIDNMMNAGFVPEARLAAVSRAAQGTAYAGRVAELTATSREIGPFGASSAANQAERLTDLRTRLESGSGTPADFDRFTRLSRVAQAQQAGWRQHGLEFAVQQGVVGPLPPLDFANPATMNARVEAVQIAGGKYGSPGSPFTAADLTQMVGSFTRGTADQALATVQGIAGIADPAVRAEAVRKLEAARGEAGRMPAGTLARVTEMVRGGSVEEQISARRIIDDLRADVSDRAKQMGESAELRTALIDAQGSGVQAMRVRQAQIGGAPFAALVSRDMDVIRRSAAVRMAGGESADRAVAAAQADWNRSQAVVDDPRLALVYFPAAAANPAQVTAGLTALRDDTSRSISSDPALGAQVAQSGIARQAAAQRAVWINNGDGFALVTTGTQAPVVLRRASIDEVKAAAEGERARAASLPPPTPVGPAPQPSVAAAPAPPRNLPGDFRLPNPRLDSRRQAPGGAAPEMR